MLDAGVDLGVVVAFGQLIKPHVLDAVPMVNVHFSLLPRWRGAAPVERAILAGDTRDGRVPHAARGGARHRPGVRVRAAPDRRPRDRRRAACRARRRSAPRCSSTSSPAGSARPRRRTGEPTYAAKIDPADLEIDWTRPAVEIDRVVRVGRAWTTFRGQRLLVLDGRPTREARGRARGARAAWMSARAPGSFALDIGAARGAQAHRRGGVAQRCAGRARRAPRLVTEPLTDARRSRSKHSCTSSATTPTRTSRCPPRCLAVDLSDRDRAFATELVYGTLRMRRACDWLVDRFVSKPPDLPVRMALRLGAYQLAFLGTAPHAAVDATVAVAPSYARAFVNAILRKVAAAPVDVPGRRDPPELSRLDRRPPRRRPRCESTRPPRWST